MKKVFVTLPGSVDSGMEEISAMLWTAPDVFVVETVRSDLSAEILQSFLCELHTDSIDLFQDFVLQRAPAGTLVEEAQSL